MEKKFRIPGHLIEPIVIGRGACIASDEITVRGEVVGYMYREPATNDADSGWSDSGWRFFAGCETQEYTDDPRNFKIYDVNTIANYDPAIIPFLDSPIMSAFERDDETGQFHPIPFPSEPL